MSEIYVEPEKPCIVYFQPRQLIFHAHGNLDGVSGVIPSLLEWANGIASSKGINLSVSTNPEDKSVFDFSPFQTPVLFVKPEISTKTARNKPAVDNALQGKLPPRRDSSYTSPTVRVPPPFSLVFANASSQNWSQSPSEKELAMELQELLDLIIDLDKKREGAPVNLEVVSPNWLMSSGSEPGGTGGPGGKPSPVKNTDIGKYNFALTLPPNPVRDPGLAQDFADVSQPGGGSDVVVAILDTAYPADQKENIYNAWAGEIGADKIPHPIINSLFGSSGRLTIHPDPSVDRYLPGTKIPGHDYDMTDHGLFVAGIINSIAPKAELHLYQVLNKYGLGDLRSIARALQDVTYKFQGRRLVVNLSLTMNLPLEDKHLHPNDSYGLGRVILTQKPWWLARLIAWLFNWIVGKPMLCTCDSWFDRQARPFEWICDLVYSLESRIIAAAGNNGQAGQGRPSALYPAAFERVYGVGALPKNLPLTGSRVRATSYSNVADVPPRNGITTLGGEPGAGNGVLGVYIGEFPNDENGLPQKNDNGWAWWCGTSFATPIISGITAIVLSNLSRNNPQPVSTETAITKLYGLEMRETLVWGEDVLDVKQS